ncbi:MAG TPA: thioredoxin-like domain-containing protein [Gemmataceae bacterium]|nr:thioredoxin-like domain-containing protein [Gemmataceae bacterium]
MAEFRFGPRLVAAVVLVAALVRPLDAAPPPTVETFLGYTPTQPGIDISTPAKADRAACTVELEKVRDLPNGKQATAWVLKDGQGKVLRKFHDTTGGGGVNEYAYYKDGEEVYRDIDANGNGKIDQYRWVGPNGSKWALDMNEDGKIDSWLVISPEEVSQEILAAIATKDFRRLEALMVTRADLDTLGLPKDEVTRIQGKVAQAAEQFKKTCQDLAKLSPQAIWVHLETKAPQTTPADALGAKADYVRYRHGTILYQEADGKDAKHNWLQTGEMIQVGKAWRIVQAPTAGMQVADGGAQTGPEPAGIAIPEGGAKHIEALRKLDDDGSASTTPEATKAFNLKRARILEDITALFTKPEERAKRDVWVRQVADCYATAAQLGDKSAMDRLGEWRKALAKDPAGVNLLAYVIFREMSSDYTQKLGTVGRDTEKLTKIQEGWKEKLSKFVADYPTAEDVPDALMQIGLVNEFLGPKFDAEAKAAYARLAKNHPTHPLAKRAQGSQDRLSLEGNDLDLSAPALGGGGAFDVKTLRGKAVVVYYWASWNDAAVADFNKIKSAMKEATGKVELVGVNLDNKPEEATAFLKANGVGGTHLHMPGGLESPLAVRYGITALPVMFVVAPDGKVASRTAQAATLDDDLHKIFKDGKDK